MGGVNPTHAQSARIHDEIIRAAIRSHGGFEVKVIGDTFMIAFATAASAMFWCLTVQSELLYADWPQEILESPSGKEIRDSEGNIIFRGLTVRMGVHCGKPIDKEDEVTGRKDYLGPMVHRAARTIEKAEGGQIVVSKEFLVESQRPGLTEPKEKEDMDGEAGEDSCKPNF